MEHGSESVGPKPYDRGLTLKLFPVARVAIAFLRVYYASAEHVSKSSRWKACGVALPKGHGSTLPAIRISSDEWDNGHQSRKDPTSCRVSLREQGLAPCRTVMGRPPHVPIQALV
jgi:hypothetical protein